MTRKHPCHRRPDQARSGPGRALRRSWRGWHDPGRLPGPRPAGEPGRAAEL